MITHHKTYTAIHLLDKIFEFTAMTPNSDLWNESSLTSNPPGLIRFRQIEALLKAFAIDTRDPVSKSPWDFLLTQKQESSISYFLRGGFMKKRAIAEYAGLVKYIKDFVTDQGISIASQNITHTGQLIMPFQQLIKFKKQLRSLLTFNSGWLEAGFITSLFSISMTNSIAANLTGKYNELDIALEMFINPHNLCFTRDELIKRFNYPDVDLTEIEMDFK